MDQEATYVEIDSHRRELQVHCYRILGSVQDAEDAVQETLLSAWRALPSFEGRSSLRTWLYRIATNRCLNMLRDGSRKLNVAESDGIPNAPRPTREAEPIWLQPFPEEMLEGLPDSAPGPEARYETRETVGLAFVSGLQRMPPRQRAALVLRDVLGYRAAEVAEMLETSEASVNSALQRARAALEAAPERTGGGSVADSPAQRELLARFADAFEAGDAEAVVALLSEDAWIRMPPEPHEYNGRAAIREFLESRPLWKPRRLRLVPTRANGQPAFAYYLGDPQAEVCRAGGIFVIGFASGEDGATGDGGVDGERIAEITRLADTGWLPYFGLPRTLPG